MTRRAGAEGWYERQLLPLLIDFVCSGRPFERHRRELIPRAQGRVLEIGIGSGLNLPFYDRARVQAIVGLDPSLQLHRLALRRSREAGIGVELIGLSAESLPLPDASFDTVVSTFTLCTIPDPVAALKELRRVLAPGGRLLFCEHGLAPDASVQRWQRRLEPWWGKVAGGCQLSRDIPALLQAAGFRPELRSRYIPGPRPLSYHYWGEATAG